MDAIADRDGRLENNRLENNRREDGAGAPGGMLDAPTLAGLLGLVHRHTGITMSERKSVLLQGRLRPRLRALSLTRYQDYLDFLARHPDEVQRFINLVTTNETSFFRTARVWEFFTNTFLPAWQANARPGQPLRIWSAAASTGEEAYSIAMLCDDFAQKVKGFSWRITATDIDTDVLATARAGVYAGRSLERVRGTHAAFFERYFSREDDGFQVSAELRRSVTFAEHNLFSTRPLPEKFDIVFLRNVLIYFNAEDQRRAVEHVRQSLVPGGWLVLGESESLGRLQTGYRFEQPLIYRNEAGTA
ncbi:MAG: CheR family methyltransferase [Burkholderiaceae bacterium]